MPVWNSVTKNKVKTTQFVVDTEGLERHVAVLGADPDVVGFSLSRHAMVGSWTLDVSFAVMNLDEQQAAIETRLRAKVSGSPIPQPQ